LLLGSLTFARSGVSIIQQTSSDDWIRLIGAGLFNLIAFVALTKALHLSSVMFVNGLNASQTAMAAVAGVLLFQEPVTIAMGAGVTLTAFGLALMRGRRDKPGDPRRAVAGPESCDSETASLELNV
jgi:drug/metabolite transporter (DMT)-like permease